MSRKTKKTKIQYVGKFLHFRQVSELDGSILPQGGATVSIVERDGKTYAAAAFCNPLDNFNFQYGRAKADGRLTRLLSNDSLADENQYYVYDGKPEDFARVISDVMILDMGYVSNGRSR